MLKGPLRKAGTAHALLTAEKPLVQPSTTNLYQSQAPQWQCRLRGSDSDIEPRCSQELQASSHAKGEILVLNPAAWADREGWQIWQTGHTSHSENFGQRVGQWPKCWKPQLVPSSWLLTKRSRASRRGDFLNLGRQNLASLHMTQKCEWIAEGLSKVLHGHDNTILYRRSSPYSPWENQDQKGTNRYWMGWGKFERLQSRSLTHRRGDYPIFLLLVWNWIFNRRDSNWQTFRYIQNSNTIEGNNRIGMFYLVFWVFYIKFFWGDNF